MAIRFYRPEPSELAKEQSSASQAVSYSRTVWSKSRSYLRKSGKESVPIQSPDGVLREFAWDDARKKVKKISADLHYFTKFTSEGMKQFLEDRGIGYIRIIGLDEIAWQFAQLMQQEQMPFHVEGKRWDYFEHGFSVDGKRMEEIPDHRVLTLMFDSAALGIGEPAAYGEIQSICDAYYSKLYFQQVRKLKDKYGDSLKLVYFPNMEEVGSVATKNEVISFYRKIDLTRSGFAEWELEILKECVSEKEWQYYNEGIYENGIQSVRDKVSDLHLGEIINITDGVRDTIGQSAHATGKLYFLGTCEILSRRTEDAATIPSLIQRRLKEQGADYNVYNYGAGSQSVFTRFQELFELEDTRDVKIICSIWNNSDLPREMADYDVTQLHFSRTNDTAWYLNDPSHLLSAGNEAIAEGIYDTIVKKMIGEKE